MKSTLLSILLCLVSFSLTAQTYSHSLEHDGLNRLYTVYTPANFDFNESLPLVINMHGLGSNGPQQTFYSDFNRVGEAENFILVYPQGSIATVNGNSAAHWNANFGTGVDDVGFLSRMIDEIYKEYNIDLSRVYSTGMSNGGYMSYVLACELGDRIAAIASVTGAMTIIAEANCNPGRAVPVMEIHGTADATVPYLGDGQFTLSSEASVLHWVENNGCDATAKITMPIEDIDTNDGSTATLDIYPGCNEDTEVQLYTIIGGGHTWPGAANLGLGVTNQDFEATDVIWEFFSRFTHPNPRAVITSTNEIELQKNIAIAPNPFGDYLILENKGQDNFVYQLVNVLGQSISSKVSIAPYSKKEISTSHLKNGIYFLVIENEEGLVTRKLIKE